jgi:hypothetical protein
MTVLTLRLLVVQVVEEEDQEQPLLEPLEQQIRVMLVVMELLIVVRRTLIRLVVVVEAPQQLEVGLLLEVAPARAELANQTVILAHQYKEQEEVGVVLMTLGLLELLARVALAVVGEAERITNFHMTEQSTQGEVAEPVVSQVLEL